MLWTINKGPLIRKFLVNRGNFAIENIEVLKDANLEIELERASEIQKLLVYSAIKFYLNYFYTNDQSIKFEELNIKGVTYDQITNAPDIRLDTENRTVCHIFKNFIFDDLLLQGSWVFILSDSNEYLLKNIDYDQKGYFNLDEKTFLSAVITFEPELIDPRKENYSNISKEVFKYAIQNIIRIKDPAKYLKELIIIEVLGEKELNDCNQAYKKLFEIIKSDEKIPDKFLAVVLEELKNKGLLYYNITENSPILLENKNKFPPEILNLILNKTDPKDVINILKYANIEDTSVLGVGSNIVDN